MSIIDDIKSAQQTDQSGNSLINKIKSQQSPTTNSPLQGLQDVATKNPVAQFGIGMGEDIGKTALGLTSAGLGLGSWAASKLGATGVASALGGASQTVKDTSSNIYGSLPKPDGIVGQISRGAGNVAGTIATLAVPGSAEDSAASKIGELASKIPGISDVGEAIKGTGLLGRATVATAKAIPSGIAQAGTGYLYGQSQGQTAKQSMATALGFGVLGTATGGISNLWNSRLENVGENVLKSLGGKVEKGTKITDFTAQATNGYKNIYDNFKGKMVEDLNGVETPFNPTKANYYELAQAERGTEQDLVRTYTQIAQKAGDSGATFGQKDFIDLIKKLEDMSAPKGDLSATRFETPIKNVITDLRKDFGTLNKADGQWYYKNATPLEIQNFIKKVNVGVDKTSEAATAVVNGNLSRTLRDSLDNKILSTTGEQYQAVRNQLRDVMTLRKGIEDQVKKAVGGQRVNVSYGEVIGMIETGLGLGRGETGKVVQGGVLAGVFNLLKRLRDPEKAMQNVFKAIEDSQGIKTKTAMGILGSGAKKVTQAAIAPTAAALTGNNQ